MMSNKKSFIYAVSANLLSTLVSATITLLLPKTLSVDSYGYFQYYLFWAGYLGILHLGWIDGLYLVHCGEYYDSIDKNVIAGQIRLFALFEGIIGVIIVTGALLYAKSYDYKLVFVCIGVLLLITNMRLFLLYILQATARIREYSVATICGLLGYLFAVGILMLLRISEYQYYIYANILSNIIPLILGFFYCWEIAKAKPATLSSSVKESISYVTVGSKLLIANFASSWIIGVVRIMIERQWDIATFGKISLTITISNMFMTFINAIALVLLPMLRRMEPNKLFSLYKYLNTLLLSLLFGGMVLYFPAQRILSIWLPEYADSLAYMALLFPICVFESKNAMILNTYMKALRKEKAIMLINVLTVGISAMLSAFAIFTLRNLTLSMFFIVVTIGMRCIAFELYLKHDVGVMIRKDVLEEVIMCFAFIICNWYVGGIRGLCIYIGIYAIYVVVNYRAIRESYDAILSSR